MNSAAVVARHVSPSAHVDGRYPRDDTTSGSWCRVLCRRLVLWLAARGEPEQIGPRHESRPLDDCGFSPARPLRAALLWPYFT